MIEFCAIVFFLTIILIAALFSVKARELSLGRTLMPQPRQRADEFALHLKDLLDAGRKDIAHLPPLLLHAGQRILHGIAVDAGHLAHWLGVQSHKLADSVSHKRNFERGETRSEFLKKVSERKSDSDGGNQASEV